MSNHSRAAFADGVNIAFSGPQSPTHVFEGRAIPDLHDPGGLNVSKHRLAINVAAAQGDIPIHADSEAQTRSDAVSLPGNPSVLHLVVGVDWDGLAHLGHGDEVGIARAQVGNTPIPLVRERGMAGDDHSTYPTLHQAIHVVWSEVVPIRDQGRNAPRQDPLGHRDLAEEVRVEGGLILEMVSHRPGPVDLLQTMDRQSEEIFCHPPSHARSLGARAVPTRTVAILTGLDVDGGRKPEVPILQKIGGPGVGSANLPHHREGEALDKELLNLGSHVVSSFECGRRSGILRSE